MENFSLVDRRKQKQTVPFGRRKTDFFIHFFENPITNFKTILIDLEDKLSLGKQRFHQKYTDALNRVMVDQITLSFKEAFDYTSSVLADPYLSKEERDDIGAKLRQSWRFIFKLTDWAERAYTKPDGPGDYFLIKNVHTKTTLAHNPIGNIIDHCFFDAPACRAIRNRSEIIEKKILDMIEAKNGETLHVTNFGCGPALEIFNVFSKIKDPRLLKVTCVDLSWRALSSISDQLKSRPNLSNQIKLVRMNLLEVGSLEKSIKNQDFFYSLGLVDYFNEIFVRRFFGKIYKSLNEGGVMAITNLHSGHKDRWFVHYVLNWELIHRNESDMKNIIAGSDFDVNQISFEFESENVNFFTYARKT